MHARSILRSRLHAVMCCSLGLALLGCAGRLEAPTRPAGPEDASVAGAGQAQIGPLGYAAQPGFYPLRSGNRWVHRLVATFQMIPGNGDPPPREVYEYTVYRRILEPIALDGRTYLPEEVTTVGETSFWSYHVLYRQDATGLYEYLAIRADGADAAGSDGLSAAAIERMIATRPPGERAAWAAAAVGLSARIAAPGGRPRGVASPVARRRWPSTAGPYDQTRLRYPLEPKARWTVGASFFPAPLEAELVDVESLEFPPGSFSAHRVRLTGGYIGPRDSAELWYGPAGFLQMVTHLEAVAGGEDGSFGVWVYDTRETLLEARLRGGPLSEWRPDDALPAK